MDNRESEIFLVLFSLYGGNGFFFFFLSGKNVQNYMNAKNYINFVGGNAS